MSSGSGLPTVHPSRSIYYCNQTCVTGPDGLQFRLTLSIVTILILLFFPFTAPYLISTDPAAAVVVYLTIPLTIFALFSMMVTTFRDPGIIPRKPPANPSERNKLGPKTVAVFEESVELKLCATCYIHRPPRATHCGICNNCVSKFDHHCTWLGTCVGQRNYTTFIWFIMSITLLVFVDLVLSLLHVVREASQNGNGALSAPYPDNIIPSVIQVIICLLVIGPITALFIFHLHLVLRGMTTNEFLKKLYADRKSPYSRGPCLNILEAFCAIDHPKFALYATTMEYAEA